MKLSDAQQRLYDRAKREGPTTHIKARRDTVNALHRAGLIDYAYTGDGYYFIVAK